MRLSKIAVNCNLDLGFAWGWWKRSLSTKQVISANGLHEFAMNFIATDLMTAEATPRNELAVVASVQTHWLVQPNQRH
jgi:hypothetical protein